MLNSRTLDVIVTQVTKRKVVYELYTNREVQRWVVPQASKFDLKQIQVGHRYEVYSEVIWSDEFDPRKGHQTRTQRYDWVTVEELPMKAKSTTRTRAQTEIAKAIASTELVGGDLFKW